MAQDYVVVDAFTAEPWGGNPAAVCVLERPADVGWMRAVAREMNLSETAFLVPRADGWDLRWFTPTVEVDLCGHATLASAHALWASGRLAADAVARFHTRSGVLTAARDGDWIRMDFPAITARPTAAVPGLADALGATPVAVATSAHSILAELADPAAVRALRPDFARLAALPHEGGAVIVTAAADAPGADFVSRFFAPAKGIPEDPATGSAHCALGPWWAAKLGRTSLVGHQVSARGAVVRVVVRGERVDLLGQAVTVARGTLLH